MESLVFIGLLSGIVTGLSPCVLPVLPVVLAASALPAPLTPGGGGSVAVLEERRTRSHPYLVVAGILTSFILATLLGSALLAALGLPQDVLRWTGIVLLALAGAALLIPQVGHAMEMLFARIPQRAPKLGGSPFLLGMLFGLVFVPCAGPVLAAITVLSATQGLSAGLVVLTVSFGIGVGIPLLAFAVAGQRAGERIRGFRTRANLVRKVSGAIMILTAVGLAFNLTAALQRYVPGYAEDIQKSIESSDDARLALDGLRGGEPVPEDGTLFDRCAENPQELQDCGPAPEITGIDAWLNSEPLALAELQGQVVLVDFWTYSCINCQRTLPYLIEWDEQYRDDGLVTIGVHTPEFAFEREERNVAANSQRLGVTYPVAIDNGYETWTDYQQRYWPAKYLIDRDGQVRHVHYGEGEYEETEQHIRSLLGLEPTVGSTSDEPELTRDRTPETYLGVNRLDRFVSGPIVEGKASGYEIPATQGRDTLALGGTWTLEPQYAEAGTDARLRLAYYARDIHLVLSGEGRVQVVDSAGAMRTVEVSGSPTLYTLRQGSAPATGVLNLALSPGLKAYALSFRLILGCR